MKAAVQYLLLLLFSIIFFTSCKTTKDVLVEPQKDLNGTWKIVMVTRNTVDITEYIDSSGFRLTLANDNTYTLQSNNIPFVVNSNGKWSVDDPQYPYNLSFNPTDSSSTFTGSIGTPASKGLRNLEVTFSPGCRANSYVYTFEKIQ
ncbi:DUF5004 domain-containing protein [Ilyomonas limi]|uniref:DUF5004 domain-containing protein n=1 Tax=Ilyomonas limi TaxID=2575867 RepID=A0A4U3KZJ0_9BACT|nr:DUF5004 domain-containing protein [Ilyomonas limi]TKK67950.1 DUF5004 domain-containing protein [Ilyomonas limi]